MGSKEKIFRINKKEILLQYLFLFIPYIHVQVVIRVSLGMLMLMYERNI